MHESAHQRARIDHYRLTSDESLFVVGYPARNVPATSGPELVPVILQQHLPKCVVSALRPSPTHQTFPQRLLAALRCCTPIGNTPADCFSSGGVTLMRA